MISSRSAWTFDLETADSSRLWSYGSGYTRIGAVMEEGYVWPVATSDIRNLVETLKGAVANGHPLAGHNVLGFDFLALEREFPGSFNLLRMAQDGLIVDTLLLAKLDDPPMARNGRPESFYDLDTLGMSILGRGKSSSAAGLAKKWGGYDQVPLDDPEYLEYVSTDVAVSGELRAHYVTRLSGSAAEYAYREHRIAAVAATARLKGMRVDLDLLPERVTEEKVKRSDALAELASRFGVESKDVKGRPSKTLNTDHGRLSLAHGLKRLGVTKRPPMTPSGKYATSAEAMEKVRERWGHLAGVNELTGLVDTATGARSIYESITKHVVGDRVHTRLNISLSTGRWAASDPNLLGVGKRGGKVRERDVFLPEDGHVFVCLDLSQVDARAVAALSGDPAYLDLFLPGVDAHEVVAEKVLGDKKYRSQGKVLHHASNYNAGADKLAWIAKCDLELAQKFDRQMAEEFPQRHQWKLAMVEEAQSGRLLDNGWGRKMRPDPERAWTQGPALMGQGCARDIMMEGVLRLPEDIQRMLVIVVHDEVVLSVPASDAEDVARQAKEALSFHWVAPGQSRGVDIVADLPKHFGTSWGKCY